MLSRFFSAGKQNLRARVLYYQPVSAITTTATASENAGKTSNPSSSNHPPEYPPPTSKRDFVNFPRPILRETPPPVRAHLIPESFFQYLYPKTGYTGPYMLFTSVVTFLLSKEYLPYDSETCHLLAAITFCSIVFSFISEKVSPIYEETLKDTIQRIDGEQENEKDSVRKKIEKYTKTVKAKSAVEEVSKGILESVYMQMEIAFRDRLQKAYLEVKRKLDCQAELEFVHRRLAQKSLMDYVMSNVMKSLTPEMEKNAMQLCIKDLNELSAKY